MSPVAQRIAIAGACGWEEIHLQEGKLFGYPRIDGGLCHESEELPDYLNDLNAVHEAEKVLKGQQQEQYTMLLLEKTNGSFNGNWPADGLHRNEAFQVAHSTVAQRAEAFLRAIGKWERDDAKADRDRLAARVADLEGIAAAHEEGVEINSELKQQLADEREAARVKDQALKKLRPLTIGLRRADDYHETHQMERFDSPQTKIIDEAIATSAASVAAKRNADS